MNYLLNIAYELLAKVIAVQTPVILGSTSHQGDVLFSEGPTDVALEQRNDNFFGELHMSAHLDRLTPGV